MTSKEKLKLLEYRYSKLCRLECDLANSYNLLFTNMDNRNTLAGHMYNVIYMDCFKSVTNDIFQLLNLEGNKNEK
jgi:hypothetical protein